MVLRTMTDAPAAAEGSVAAEALAAPPGMDDSSALHAPQRRRRWRQGLSAGLFALVTLCFVLAFASTSCTAPGGYGRGALGTSTVYRGVDLALDAVPAVTPSDARRARVRCRTMAGWACRCWPSWRCSPRWAASPSAGAA